MRNRSLHTVLGASGATGRATIQALQNLNLPVRAVTRSRKIQDVDTVHGDVLNLEDASRVIEGSSHVYLCVGLPYRTDVWKAQWPLLMQNVIQACEKHKAVLVFLDNVYLYGPAPLADPFDENHPQNPPSQKGLARKETRDLMIQAMESGRIQGVIGRAADFFGSFAVNSPFYISFLERMLQGKAPQALAFPGVPHTFANVSDIGRALVALGQDPETYGQEWHLPVGPPTTFEEMVLLFNKELGTSFKVSFLPSFLRNILSLFMSPVREASHMLYQYQHPYIMSFDKFKNHFPDFQVSPYAKGVEEMVHSFKEQPALTSNL